MYIELAKQRTSLKVKDFTAKMGCVISTFAHYFVLAFHNFTERSNNSEYGMLLIYFYY